MRMLERIGFGVLAALSVCVFLGCFYFALVLLPAEVSGIPLEYRHSETCWTPDAGR